MNQKVVMGETALARQPNLIVRHMGNIIEEAETHLII
jgi:hypothetical protein